MLRFVPAAEHLDAIFKSMNECQAVYPDSNSGDEESDEERYNQIGYEQNFADDQDAVVEITDDQNPMTYFDEQTDPDNVELSAKGQEILRRLNLNFIASDFL